MSKKQTDLLDNIEVNWTCRFHPTDWFHEVGCPHQEWTKEQLREALITSKKSQTYQLKLLAECATRTREEDIKALESLIRKYKPGHGECCTCQGCGESHDECACEHNRAIDEAIQKLKSLL